MSSDPQRTIGGRRPAWLSELQTLALEVVQNDQARAPDLSLVAQVLGLVSEDLADREDDATVDGILATRVITIAGRVLDDPETEGTDLRTVARVIAMVMSVAGGTPAHLSTCEEHVRILLEVHRASGQPRSDHEDAARILLDGARDMPANREARLDLAFEVAHMAFEAKAPMLLMEALDALRIYECGDPIPAAWFLAAAEHARTMGWPDQALRLVASLTDVNGSEPAAITTWKETHAEWLLKAEGDADLPRLVVTEAGMSSSPP
jgi:hypothetical protein